MPQFQLFESDHVSLFPCPQKILCSILGHLARTNLLPQITPPISPHRNIIDCELNTFSLPPEILLSHCELPLPIRL